MNTGKWIEELIKKNGNSVEEIADLLNISRAGLYKILNSDNIRENHVEKLSEIYDCSPEFIRYGYKKSANDINTQLSKKIILAIENYLDSRAEKLAAPIKAELFNQLYSRLAEQPEVDVDSIVTILNVSSSLKTNL
jgi:transcriptional regulator with XRE-family HTH domain